eukprot:TRINITY_DN19251_c0_g1_i1.p1 TRINITY_DN19251_c0_g1~~TRINITY_DN19251_c0_g1_i1.p1  ORF type:complete len:199 (-),score=41.35 TRINITY_DN19251_c0_g1_i1:415-990(-)
MADSATPSASSGEGGRLYNPYQDLHGALDSRSLDHLYRLPDAPEFLFQEEAHVQRRSWSDNLTYYTGCGYLAGAVVGGGYGLAEGLRTRPDEGIDTWKLRVNKILNSSGHRGRTAGNALGILGLLYAGMESAAAHYRSSDDIFNNILAGFGTGALYKAAAGPRTAVIAGVVGGFAASGLAGAKYFAGRLSG